jgi:pyruvate,water dikinase
MVIRGKAASPGVRIGRGVIVRTRSDCKKVNSGDVVILKRSDPELVFAVIQAIAVVADIAGTTSHLATIARELNIPCVVATDHACELVHEGTVVTVDGDAGEVRW